MSRDSSRLLDILNAARSVIELTEGMTGNDFQQDFRTELAITRLFEIIGEAARLVSEDLKRDHPEIPWGRMAGLRHRLIHEYDKVDYDLVWKIIQRDVPELIRLIEPLVPPEE
ncbi:DUF86 domain-containing protein [bacterium]|nr:DUF86 domain-containing protein [bacterium]